MSNTRIRFKLKVTSDDEAEIQAAVDDVLSRYPRATSSPVLRSQPRGWHAFITVYAEVERRG